MALFDFTSFISSTFVFQYFVPFIILFAIFWGLIEMIGRFKTKINLVLSLGFAMIAVYTNPWILVYIATLGSYAAVVLFGVIFIFGIIRWSLGRGQDIYYDTASKSKKLDKLIKESADLTRKLNGTPENSKERLEVFRRLKDVNEKIEMLRIEMKQS
jgi:hypothetical protein